MAVRELSQDRSLDDNIYDAIVIGMGAAGIAAFSRLNQKNFKILGLEAANRTGGRIWSVPFANGTIDLGAEWCHGEVDNVVYDMVKDKDLLKSSDTIGLDKITFVNSKGKLLPKDVSDKLSELCCDITIYGREKNEANRRSLGHNFISAYDDLVRSPSYSNIEPDLTNQVLEWFHKYENSIEASDKWEDSAGRTYSEYWECEGEALLHWKGRGYRTILDILLNSHPEAHSMETDDRLLNKKVSNIKWLKNGSIENTIRIKCEDDSVYFAKHVIVTVSLGVLQASHKTLFSPPLPLWKVNSIDNLVLGTVDKIFLHFEKRWWADDMDWVAFLWDETDKNVFSDNDAWLYNVFGFNSNNWQKDVLCLWITGEMARHMERLPIEVVKDGVMRLLNIFFANIYEISPVKDVLRSTWDSNPLTRGSYSFRSMDTELNRASADILGKPLESDSGIPVICFAGEATSTHYYSTVHGAIESGFRESQRIIDHIESKRNNVPFNFEVNPDKLESFKAVVIGAGIAGLGAAKTLLSNGVKDIKLLEAYPDIGGRICSFQIDDEEFLELGAQWVHGKNNKLSHFAMTNNLLSDVISYEGEGKFVRFGGLEYSNKDVSDVCEAVNKILKACELFANSDKECNFSVGEYLESEFEKHLKDHVNPEDHGTWRDIFEWHKRFHIVDNSCETLNHLSAKAWGDYDFDGEDCQMHINLKNGFASLLDKLKESIPTYVLKTSTTAERIVWNTTNKVRVYCSDGTVAEADHVIITVSLGVLKAEHNRMFIPALPQNHQTAIRCLGFGRIGKIYLKFDASWWGECKGFQFIWSSDDNIESKFKGKESWLKHISGFDVVTVGPSNTLLGWVGSEGEKVLAGLADDEVLESCHKLLQVFTGKVNLPKPTKVYRSKWGENPYVRGGYSHITRECDEYGVKPSNLSESIFNDNGQLELLFAGEACHSSFFSTVHGAYESGIEQAEKICRLYNKNSKL